jgi:hypothetical protein
LARPSRFERLTPSLGGKCSIQLSYGRNGVIVTPQRAPRYNGLVKQENDPESLLGGLWLLALAHLLDFLLPRKPLAKGSRFLWGLSNLLFLASPFAFFIAYLATSTLYPVLGILALGLAVFWAAYFLMISISRQGLNYYFAPEAQALKR